MKNSVLTMATVPNDGCARCFWWWHPKHSPWGRCRVNSDERWYQAPPCPEYERNNEAPDEIEVYL